MNLLDRILLAILSIGGLCFGIIVAVLAWYGPGAGFGDWIASPKWNLAVVICTAVVVLIAIRFLFYRRANVGRDIDFVVLPGESGDIRISFETIRQLANRTGQGMRGVQDFDTRVRQGQTGILLVARVRVLPDIPLSPLSQEIQTTVKDYVEQMTGVLVERLMVNIMEVAGSVQRPARARTD